MHVSVYKYTDRNLPIINNKFFLKVYFDHGLQLDGVSSKLADAVRQFLHGHAVFVVLPAESLLIQVDLLQITDLGYKNKQTIKVK